MARRRAVRAVLWDADGVLQHAAAGWREVLDGANGDGFADAVFAAEQPALRGEEPLRTALARVVDAWPHAGVGVEDLLRLWERAVPDPAALALVDEVRASGVRTVLATNQQDHRRAWMRDVLRTDEHFDDVFYSCEMGVAKPDPAYFRHVLDRLGLPPAETAFVDDLEANVTAAAGLGIVAVRHDPASGAAALRREVRSLLRPGDPD